MNFKNMHFDFHINFQGPGIVFDSSDIEENEVEEDESEDEDEAVDEAEEVDHDYFT